MTSTPTSPHALRRMAGRDLQERHRAATPLELLFDLTFVVAFATAGNEMAHMLAAGHTGAAIAGFAFAIFAITWAWINFTWFASAFDTDDWAYRLTTMVQMIGVVILALGLPAMFASLEHGQHVDNRVMVIGYVVMRVAMLTQWLRASRQSRGRRRTCLVYVASIAIAQLGWVVIAVADTSILVFAVAAAVLIGVETIGPYAAEHRDGGTPWHAHHIAERYSLLAIITLGEGVVGSVVSLAAAISANGWDLETAVLACASMGLTFAIWWIYFNIPFGELLHARRERSFGFGYGHIPLFGAIAALGAGLHTVAYYVEAQHDPEGFAWVRIGPVGAVVAVAVPVIVFLGTIFAIWSYLFRSKDLSHAVSMSIAALAIVATVALVKAGAPVAWCLILLCLAPAVIVAVFELRGHSHQAHALTEQTSVGPGKSG